MKRLKWTVPVLASILLCGGVIAQPDQTTNTNQTTMTNACQAMMQMRQQMHQQIKAQDQELSRLTQQMNGAPAANKVDALVQVVNKLVEDRLTMHQMMETNMQTMRHYMGHMGTNCPMNCPAWKGEKGETQ